MKKLITIAIIILTLFSSCSTVKKISQKMTKPEDERKITYNRVLKSNNYDLKFDWAVDLYDRGKYVKASDLFQQLIPHEKGRERGEIVYFYYAMCNYNIGDYLFAGYYFKNFYDMYPNSDYAEKALFLSAYCYFKDSPRWELDQDPTKQAITQFELFLSVFPKSKYVDSSNFYIDTMRLKLEKKEYMAAKQYYDMEYYKAASIALENAMKDYPDSPFNDDAMFYKAKSELDYAHGSISTKKAERYKKTINTCKEYKMMFPQGRHTADIEKIMADAEKGYEKHAK